MAAPGLRTLYLLVVVVLMALQAQCYSPQALRAFMPSGHMALSRRNQALVIRAEGTTTGQSGRYSGVVYCKRRSGCVTIRSTCLPCVNPSASRQGLEAVPSMQAVL